MMRRAVFAFLAFLPALACAATQGPEGRWEGRIKIPGSEQPVVIDLATAGDGWIGSIIFPGLGIKGAPLSNIVTTPGGVAFDIVTILGTPTFGPAHFDGRLDASGAAGGEMRQGGNVAPFSLTRTGAAQVDVPLRSTPIRRALEGQWSGEFELGGYPRHVTMTLVNHADGVATAALVVVGKQTTNVPVDRVAEEGAFITIESNANQVTFEGRLIEESDEIKGTFRLGPFELPLALRRSSGRTS